MSIATAITDLKGRIEDAYDALEEKGATIPATKNTYNLPTTIGTIQGGGGTTYGMTVENIIGEVDANGQLVPTSSFSFMSNDIKSIPSYGLYHKFYKNTALSSVSLPNLTSIGTYGL